MSKNKKFKIYNKVIRPKLTPDLTNTIDKLMELWKVTECGRRNRYSQRSHAYRGLRDTWTAEEERQLEEYRKEASEVRKKIRNTLSDAGLATIEKESVLMDIVTKDYKEYMRKYHRGFMNVFYILDLDGEEPIREEV